MTPRLVPAALVACAACVAAGCGDARSVRALGNDAPAVPARAARHVDGGDATRGRRLLDRHACTTCHAIPGEREPPAFVGPPLAGFARRTNIGGTLPNRPEVLIRFLMNAPAELPGTGMPNLQLDEAQARDLAALLYTLQ